MRSGGMVTVAWLLWLLPQDPLRAEQEETGEASAGLGTGVCQGAGCPPGDAGTGSAGRRAGRVGCPLPLPRPHVPQSLPHPLALSHRHLLETVREAALCSIPGLPRFPTTITEQGQARGRHREYSRRNACPREAHIPAIININK